MTCQLMEKSSSHFYSIRAEKKLLGTNTHKAVLFYLKLYIRSCLTCFIPVAVLHSWDPKVSYRASVNALTYDSVHSVF